MIAFHWFNVWTFFNVIKRFESRWLSVVSAQSAKIISLIFSPFKRFSAEKTQNFMGSKIHEFHGPKICQIGVKWRESHSFATKASNMSGQLTQFFTNSSFKNISIEFGWFALKHLVCCYVRRPWLSQIWLSKL